MKSNEQVAAERYVYDHGLPPLPDRLAGSGVSQCDQLRDTLRQTIDALGRIQPYRLGYVESEDLRYAANRAHDVLIEIEALAVEAESAD